MLKNEVKSYGLPFLAFPHNLACGRDEKSWPVIKNMLSYIFCSSTVKLYVYELK